jgi:hypothetical protein
MTDNDKLAILSQRIGNTTSTTALLRSYLFDAQEIILNKIYEVAERPIDAVVPSKYDSLHIRITEYLYYRRGSEGQTVHNEGGINRTYASSTVPREMLKEITPEAGV